MRQLFAFIAGLIVALLIIIMLQMIKEGLYPTPRGLDFNQKDLVLAWMETLPPKAFLISALAHGLAAFSAGFIASLTAGSGRMTTGIMAASVIFILVMVYLFTYYFPAWFVVTDTVVTSILGFTGVVSGSTRIVS